MITLTPSWTALKAQCSTPALIERYNRYTLQLLNGYMGFGLAIDYMKDAIKAESTDVRSDAALYRSLPMPTKNPTGRHIPSIITRYQAAKIVPLLRSPEDGEAVLRMFTWWNGLDAKEQMIHTAEGNGNDFFEIGLADNGVTIVVSIYRMDDDAIYLKLDPDCDIVIREVAL